MSLTKMNNIAFEQFFNWLRTTNHTGPVGMTAKFYVKGEVISENVYHPSSIARVNMIKSKNYVTNTTTVSKYRICISRNLPFSDLTS